MSVYTRMEEHSLLLSMSEYQIWVTKVKTSHTLIRNVRSFDVTKSLIWIWHANFAEPKIFLGYTEEQKHIEPSTYASEIKHSLLLDQVVHPKDLLGTSQINQRLREDLLFGRNSKFLQLDIRCVGRIGSFMYLWCTQLEKSMFTLLELSTFRLENHFTRQMQDRI